MRALALFLAAVAVTVALGVGIPAALAGDNHQVCQVSDRGTILPDPYTGELRICTVTPTGNRWELIGTGVEVAAPTPASTTTVTPITTPPSTVPVNSGFAPVAGGGCQRPNEQRLSPAGTTLICTVAGPAQTWTEIAPGAQGYTKLVPLQVPFASYSPGESSGTADPLDPDLGNPTGLPPGVALPPGTTVIDGFPQRLPSEDWWKNAEWLTEGHIATTDMEAVSTWFGDQCAKIGWWFDPLRVERYPNQNPPGPGYDRSVSMVAGECRTTAGSAGDPTRKRPWFLWWSVALRPGATQLELVVEVRSHTRLGGRPG
jgi:hypothetical protein